MIGTLCRFALLTLLAVAPVTWAASPEQVPTVHGLSLYGEPGLPAGFTSFPYVNPNAPKGGSLTRAAPVSFNSTNPFIITGSAASGIDYLGQSYLYDSLMVSDPAEIFSAYGLLASGIRLDPQRRWMEFDLDPRARFHDGEPVTAEDVVFTFNLLVEKGAPFFRGYYADVTSVRAEGPLTVHFDFAEHNSPELPLILGQLPVLPAHYWKDRDFTRPTLEIPVGSGPYRIERLDPGRQIVYRRDPDYWARDLPVNRGRFNIDRLIFDTYLDDSVALEAFRAGNVDLRVEMTASNWATGYQGPAMERGLIGQLVVANHNPAPLQAFVPNLRRAQFQDPRVRRAIGLAYDFEWQNRNLFYSQYRRTRGMFDGSEMEATGLPEGEELALLEPLRDQLPPEVFEEPLPIGEPSDLRERLRQALALLEEAGYRVENDRMVDAQGHSLSFEILLWDGRMQRMVLPYVRNLRRIGIDARVRVVDPSQYQVRISQHDYDMIIGSFAQSSSPGNEQREFWTSDYADRPQSRNTAGIRNPAIDQLVESLIRADSRESLDAHARALDRALRWNFYLVPQYHNPGTRIAYWRKLAFPLPFPDYGLDLDAWWVDSQRASRVEAAQDDQQP
ncbi:ABC transporter substrate-binding protein [Halotalea alkalilenta]|uniref:ABC transporter substrate-binding protein n=1 Tax=Halotalea alkalilenta TaxID=376489 RepID=UPI000487C67F